MEISWKRNFYTLWIAQLIAIIGFQAIQPFLPYYIQEFDVADLDEALLWAGQMGTAAGLSMALSAPLWGILADRFGRKAMVVRAMLGGGVAVSAMAYVTTLEQLMTARIVQGVLSGTVAACTTLVSTTTPRQHLGYALGLMQGAVMLGVSLGPLFGGPVIERYGYEPCFLAAGILVALAGVVVKIWVKEDFQPRIRTPNPTSGRPDSGLWRDATRLLRLKPYLIMVVSLTMIQFTFAMVMPVLPLFLQKLAATDNIVSLAGRVFSLMGLVGAISSAVMGRFSDRLGAKRMLIAGLLTTALLMVVQGLSTTVLMLATFRILNGVSIGVIQPVANALIARVVPDEDRGKAFGLLTSATAFGFALGPMAGAHIGVTLGFPAVFAISGIAFLCLAGWVWLALLNVDLDEPDRQGLRRMLAVWLRRPSQR